ncbi:hypothetical protein ADEAN_000904700 [Angomonas deanei]|uniref:Uncharacterized protein n=1 Tax=Angomonas deanei TaxID=59799 RepID=A0A7G2CPU8_9TRYP|nr:hypothetical protein ADEAN_000904700 [Angomonas deanei]
MEQADPNVRQEFNAQLEYLSTSVDALRKKVKSDQERHRKEASAMMEENLGLIREIHSLRQTIQQLRTKIASDEAAKRSRSGARVGTFKKKKGGTMTSTKGGSAGSSRRRASSAGAGGYDEEVDGDGNNNNNNEPGRTTSAGPTFTGVDDDDGTNKRQPPKILEANRTNIRMQRAYIEAMQRSLAEYGSNVKLPSIKK